MSIPEDEGGANAGYGLGGRIGVSVGLILTTANKESDLQGLSKTLTLDLGLIGKSSATWSWGKNSEGKTIHSIALSPGAGVAAYQGGSVTNTEVISRGLNNCHGK
ncbi:MAG: hypothetical protein KIT79_08295 [Deltaproteobacteria bacterium]|nr:hypothetical protein [Deltaproteobacteria bacterium]